MDRDLRQAREMNADAADAIVALSIEAKDIARARERSTALVRATVIERERPTRCARAYLAYGEQRCASRRVVAELRAGALDAHAVPFGRSSIRMPEVDASIARAVACDSDEEFESRVFDLFDLAAKRSRDRGDRLHANPFRVQRVKRFIERHLSEPLTLDAIAAAVNVSPFVLIRQFKQATGLTPYAYLLECRVRAARSLLRADRASIETISRRIGFDDPNYFSRMFKRATGITPTGFRRRHATVMAMLLHG